MIYMDKAQRDYDGAQTRYRRAYNRGYSLSERGEHERAQRILDAAKAAFAEARKANPVPSFVTRSQEIERLTR